MSSFKELTPQLFAAQLHSLSCHQHYVVALSGGLDSSVLLHLMAEAHLKSNSYVIDVIHINHGIHPKAQLWAEFCQQQAANYGLTCQVLAIPQPLAGNLSLEEALRAGRMALWQQHVPDGAALVLAHHSQDQAETLLMRLIKGTSIRGIACMRARSAYDRVSVLRPLLSFDRSQLEAYARHHQLQWIEDDSNRDLGFERNYIRHKILPPILQRWPQALKQFGRAVQLAQSLDDELQRQAVADLQQAQDGRKALRLKQLPKQAERRYQVLRAWLRQFTPALKSYQFWHHLEQQVINACSSAQPELKLGEASIRRHRETLYYVPAFCARPQAWGFRHGFEVLRPWGLEGELRIGQGLSLNKIGQHTLSIQSRQGGERLRLPGRDHHHSLRRYLQMLGLPPWERDRLPLIWCGSELIAVAHLWLNASWQATGSEPGICFKQLSRTAQVSN